MELRSEIRGDALIVTVLAARIDAAHAVLFKDAMQEAAAGGPGRVILDLAHVAFIDSSGLGAIVAVMKLLAPGQSLELAALSSTVEKVFALTRMDKIFSIHRSADAALPPQQSAG